MNKLQLIKTILFFLVFCGFSYMAVSQENKTIVKSKLNSVSVYSVGAEMNHSVSAMLKRGNNELVFTNVSNNVDINSIQVKSPSTVTILGVEFANHYIAPIEKSTKVRQLEDSINGVQREYESAGNAIQNNRNLQQVLDANRDIKGQQNGLNVAELMKFVDYYKVKSSEFQNEVFQYTDKRKKAEERLVVLRKRLQEELQNEAISGGRLVVKISSALATTGDFTFSYISPNASWIPTYDIKANNLKDPLQLVFKAKVSQTTGIDWKQVRLSLSTSIPSQYGEAPLLQQWFLNYVMPYTPRIAMSNSVPSYAKESAMSVSADASYDGYVSKQITEGKFDKKAQTPPIYIVNGDIMDAATYSQISQSLVKSSYYVNPQQAINTYGDVAGGGAYIVDLKTDIEDYINVSENSLNMNFDIALPYDILTNGQSQTIQIQTKEIPTLYKHYSVPKLGVDAYLLAEIPNFNTYSLLPGEANIVFENTYIGKTYINPASTNDTLNLTMGKDKRISVKRQKIEDFSSNKFLGSTKTQKFTYETTVKNNKNEASDFTLKDQFPLSTMKEVEVELLESSDASVNKELGVLTWHLKLAAGETKKVRFSYTVKYPKDKILNLEK